MVRYGQKENRFRYVYQDQEEWQILEADDSFYTLSTHNNHKAKE